ncbi:MAG TPA: hypothetical protein VGI06_01535 [Acidimicrobiales bacterium]
MNAWPSPQLDEAAARALAVVTLVATGRPGDEELASDLVTEATGRAGGAEELIGGFVSLCATLVVMLEFEAHLPPPQALREAGRLIAEAGVEPRHLTT